MKKVRHLPWYVKHTILAVLSIIFVSPAAYSADKSKATPSEICSVVSYDSDDRIACVETSNILGGKDRTVTEYTFSGKPLSMAVTHTAAGKLTAEENYGYTYDALDRPLQTRYSINNGQSVTLADNRYDELGRLLSDRRNGSASLATEYGYNLHGMPTRISTPLYTENLFYEQPHNGSTPQYGGNISAIDWSVADESDTYGKRGYTFSYDGMSRLTAAAYLENGKLNNHFSTSYKYDLMGNILTLRREGLLDSGDYGTIDDLTYSYEGNKVVKIDDAADESPNYSGAMHFRDAANEETEYTYDANGNMLTDSNKGITSIDYNVLDLPQCIKTRPRIIFKENTGNAIYYTYSADGTKLCATYKEADSRTMPYKPNASYNNNTGLSIKTNGMVTPMVRSLESNYYYCSNLVYNDDRLSTILFDGGYASVDEEDGIVIHFYVKDHLGSNRLVVDGNGNIEEVNHYYPFGALMGDRCGVSRNKYKYIGKELDTMYGWNMQDHEARWYDPVLGLWHSIDMLAEKAYNISSYVYCHNSPIISLDPNGKDDYKINASGELSFWRRTNAKSTHRVFCGKNSILVGRNLVDQLVKNQNSQGSYALITNSDDAFKFFTFAANYTNVEWLLIGVKNNSGVTFKLSTNFNNESVSNESNDAQNMLFHLHNHPWGTNLNGTKASGNYKEYNRVPSGEKVSNYYTNSDLWTLNNIYNTYKEANPKKSIESYPKTYIYYSGDKNQKKQLYEYNLKRARFNPLYTPTYEQIKNQVYKK